MRLLNGDTKVRSVGLTLAAMLLVASPLAWAEGDDDYFDGDDAIAWQRLTEEDPLLPEPLPPSTDELLEGIALFREQGVQGLLQSPYFRELLGEHEHDPTGCGTPYGLTFLSMASHVDAEDLVIEALESHEDSIADVHGPEWELTFPDEIVLEDDPEMLFGDELPDDVETDGHLINLEFDEYVFDPDMDRTIRDATFYYKPPPTLPPDFRYPPVKADPVTTRNRFDMLCQHWSNAGSQYDYWRELTYTVPNEFKIHYRICGSDAIPEDRLENKTFLYPYPDGTAARIRTCVGRYDDRCAPTHIQMIAADLLYVRNMLRSEGFRVPQGLIAAGPLTTPEIPVWVTDKNSVSTAHLGKIWLHRPGAKARWLSFHEYSHLIQETYGSIGALIMHGASAWRAPRLSRRTPEHWYWSILESTAEWIATSLLSRYPLYDGKHPWDNGNGFPFQYAYAPLIYGYLGEVYTHGSKPGPCVGCDEILDFFSNSAQPTGWSSSTVYGFLLSKNIRLKALIRAFQGDLLTSIFAGSNHTYMERFVNRDDPDVRANSWPPDFREFPSNTTLCNATQIHSSKASPVAGQSLQRQAVRCTDLLAAPGVSNILVKLTRNDLPSSLKLTATAVEAGGSSVLGDLRIFAYEVDRQSGGELDYRKRIVRQDSTGNRSVQLAPASHGGNGINEVWLQVTYPPYWTSPHANTGMLTVTLDLVAEWP